MAFIGCSFDSFSIFLLSLKQQQNLMKIMFSCIRFPVWPYNEFFKFYTGKLYGLAGMCIVVAWAINNLIYVLVRGKGLRQALPFTNLQHNRKGKVSEQYTRNVYFHSCFSFILTSLCPSSHQKNIINKNCCKYCH